ncbi:histone-lysine N-methyltransferase, H3 lysine-79 specific [Trichomonascus vanleenenianus]|uniref:histone methyltransferase DOT1 n=1 Tax=Trichomonascus vanleenenianus TaxID=2268995 RepID=UPI003ECA21EA
MFFAKLTQNVATNKHHPSNSAKNTNEVKYIPKVKKSSSKASKSQPIPTKIEGDTPKKKRKSKPGQKVSSSPGSPAAKVIKFELDSIVSRTPSVGPQDKVDPSRDLVIVGDASKPRRIIAGADLVEKSPKLYKDTFSSGRSQFYLELPYGRERYLTAQPKKPEEYDPHNEVEQVMALVSESGFVPQQYRNDIKDPDMKDSIVRRMKQAVKKSDSKLFRESIDEFNALIKRLRDSGELAEAMNEMQHIPFSLVSELLNQVYSRVVSPRTHELRNYKAFSNNVYGELLPTFVSRLFDDTGLDSTKVFIDLGSGVGNCVLQAALEVGCESWGCEMMETASELADLQRREFQQRVKMYGIKPGKITLRAGDFVEDTEILKKLPAADVLLINNYAFDSALNGKLVDMFLDLKEGCKIVSLKSFVPQDHVITQYNIGSPLNILRVEKRHFGSGSVSWTHTGGDYYISTIDRSRLKHFLGEA